MNETKWSVLFIVTACGLGCSSASDSASSQDSPIELKTSTASALHDGTPSRPLRVMLIPADGGTDAGTRADFEPVFAAITREYDLHFEIRVGQAYNAVVEGMVNAKIDVAFFGPVTFHQAKQRGAAELLAVGVSKGQSIYYAGIFTNRSSGFQNISDLAGRSIAFGDVNSASSFMVQVAMLIDAGVDPVRDLKKIYLTGSHANALAALAAGKVDAACASFSSFEKSVENGQLNPDKTIALAKSEPIPYPPLAMHVDLDSKVKLRLRKAISHVHQADGVTPDMIRGYGGKKIERYDTDYAESEFDRAMSKLSKVSDALKAEMLRKAAEK
ncbi:MAG: phosphate/phosphite/phosphonate ABC transporter substrate-binding protein [Planctomycetaceae bacterium]